MAQKNFALRTEPHVATIGDAELFFVPEVVGAEFAEHYGELRALQQKAQSMQKDAKASSTKHAKNSDTDPKVLIELSKGMRKFIRYFLVEESKTEFDSMRLPDRILVQLLEWVSELYGGGSGNDHGGQSSESSPS